MTSPLLEEPVAVKIETEDADINTDIVNNNNELHTNVDEVVELESDYLEVKIEEVTNSIGGAPELEVLRVESPKLTMHKRLRWNASRRTSEPMPPKRTKVTKAKAKCKPPAKKKEVAKETSCAPMVGCPNRNQFCYVCGLFAPQNSVRNLTKSVVTAFEELFAVSYVSNLSYVPEVVCEYCYRSLMGWKSNSNRHKIKYVRPVTWLPQPTEHLAESCYFCLTKTTGYRYSTRERIVYADVESVIKARVLSEQYPIADASADDGMIASKDLPEPTLVNL